MAQNPQRTLRNLIPTDQIDLPQMTQDAINRLSYGLVLDYDDEADRDDVWEQEPFKSHEGVVVCTLRDHPMSLFVRNPDTRKWVEYSPKPEVAQGSISFLFKAGNTVSEVSTKKFSRPFTAPPFRVDFSRESGAGIGTQFDAYVVAGSITSTEFKAVCTVSAAISGSTDQTRTLPYEAIRWY